MSDNLPCYWERQSQGINSQQSRMTKKVKSQGRRKEIIDCGAIMETAGRWGEDNFPQGFDKKLEVEEKLLESPGKILYYQGRY